MIRSINIKKSLLFLIFIYFIFYPILIAYAKEDFKPSGPIPITNQNPLYIFFLNPSPDTANVQEKEKLDFDIRYSMANVNIRQSSYHPSYDIDRVELDMEVHKLDLVFTYGLTERSDIQLDVPYLIFWGGLLDNVVDFFEDLLEVTSPSSRGERKANAYKYFVRSSRQTLIDKEDPENGLGDLVCSFKYKLTDERVLLPTLSLRTAIKFPTGSENKLLGSGKFDYDFGILGQKRLGRLYLYCNFDTVFIKKPDVFAPLSLDKYMTSVFLGTEYFFNHKFSLILQGGMSSTPFPKVKLVTSLEHPPVHIGLGINYKINDSLTFKTAIVENGTSAWPDITLYNSIKLKF